MPLFSTASSARTLTTPPRLPSYRKQTQKANLSLRVESKLPAAALGHQHYRCSGLWILHLCQQFPNSPAFLASGPLPYLSALVFTICHMAQVHIIPSPGSVDYAKTSVMLIPCRLLLFCKAYSLEVRYHHTDSLVLCVSTARACKNGETSW